MKYIKPVKTFEFVIEERRVYAIQGDGRDEFEARQDAIERFHRLSKSKELVCTDVSKPRIVSVVADDPKPVN